MRTASNAASALRNIGNVAGPDRGEVIVETSSGEKFRLNTRDCLITDLGLVASKGGSAWLFVGMGAIVTIRNAPDDGGSLSEPAYVSD